jgi:sulfite exporter TauE/SafE
MTLALAFRLSEVNLLAVLVTALGIFLVGGAWYTALFGKLWAALNGYSPEKLKEMGARRPPPVFFGTLLACYVVISFAMAMVIRACGVSGALDGAAFGLCVWVIVAAVGITGQAASDKRMSAWLVDGAYQLIYLVGAGMVLASWH